MSETSKPEAWQRGVYIGLHHDIHFLRYAQRRVFADVPVRLGNRTYRAGGIQSWHRRLGRTDTTKTVKIIEKRSFLHTRYIKQKPSETQRFYCQVPATLRV